MFGKKLKKAAPFLVLIFVYGVLGILGFDTFVNKKNYDNMGTILLRWGSKGEQVKSVQWKLVKWGYYKGKVDGRYGYGTRKAVIAFQKKNGLRADGVVGNATAKKLGIYVPPKKAASRGVAGKRNSDIYTLAQAIHGEARGEPYIGQVAVGAVILNRVEDPRFPKTVAGVIFQPGAFTAVADGQMFMKPDASSMKAARDALNGWDPSGGAVYYYNPAKATSKWIWSRPIIKVIGKHYFCR